ncbi:LacI family DNA-binding transcriptional regulator [Roseibium sp.]|uniref:LacI family DNA-binding transcriptional regulator n=1 Tax=Roseibium sp. TaxID=1936156 RepID=UPI003D0B8CC2
MSGKITLRDVAKAAQVAESTASRALAGSGQLSEDTRQRILNAAASLGYEASARAPTVSVTKSGRRGVIGVVVAALHNSFYPYLLDRLHNELDDLGFDMVLIIDEITRDRAGRKLRSLLDILDGVIVTTAMIDSPMVEFLKDREMPTVLAIRSNQKGDVHVVESDNYSAGAEAMSHLLSLGHRRIGFLMGPDTTSTTAGRLEGAKAVLKNAGVPFETDLMHHTEFTHEGGYSGCIHLLRSETPPTAIFCANDVIAIGALDAAQKIGLKVPEDVSIIGVDDIPMASWSMISLTTVRQPIGEIGSMAAKLISEAVRDGGDGKAKHHILPTSLVMRATTGVAKED